jgi:nucleotide-binding universal stress UspA family protein
MAKQDAIKKILAPIDGSEGSRRGLELAIAMARAHGAELTLLEIIEEFGPLPGLYEAPANGQDRTTWLAEERWEPLRSLVEASDVPWSRRVEEGNPADVICTVAEADGFDLVVMGSHGLSAVGRFLIGSVSDRVVHHCPCSVTIAR